MIYEIAECAPRARLDQAHKGGECKVFIRASLFCQTKSKKSKFVFVQFSLINFQFKQEGSNIYTIFLIRWDV